MNCSQAKDNMAESSLCLIHEINQKLIVASIMCRVYKWSTVFFCSNQHLLQVTPVSCLSMIATLEKSISPGT